MNSNTSTKNQCDFLIFFVNMALIKCPECGNEVSSIADTCPKCGYPVKKYLNFMSQEIIENKDEFPEPISDEWVQKFYRIKKENCVFCFVCFMIFFVAFISTSYPNCFNISNIFLDLSILFCLKSLQKLSIIDKSIPYPKTSIGIPL